MRSFDAGKRPVPEGSGDTIKRYDGTNRAENAKPASDIIRSLSRPGELPDTGSGKPASELFSELQEVGRGEKTPDQAALIRAKAMVNKWQAEDLSGANRVRERMILNNFPVRAESASQKAIDRLRTERILLENAPGMDSQIVTREWGEKVDSEEQTRTGLERKFPNSPQEVLTKEMQRRQDMHMRPPSREMSFDEIISGVMHDPRLLMAGLRLTAHPHDDSDASE